MLQAVSSAPMTPVRFTAGDLIEGLCFLSTVRARAVLFALEQGMRTCEAVIDLTHAQLRTMQLTELAAEAARATPRQLRLNHVFWEEVSAGAAAPLYGLERQVCAAFGGMTWGDLLLAYRGMVWVDGEIEAEHFRQGAAKVGIRLGGMHD